MSEDRVLPSLMKSNDEYMAALELKEDGYLEEAEKHALKSLEIKENVEALLLIVDILEKQNKDSSQYIRKLLEDYPLNPETYRRLYLSNFEKNKEDALTYINKAIGIMRKGIYYEDKAKLLLSMKRYIESLASIDQAIKLENRNSRFWTLRGSILIELGRLADAKEAEDVAVKLDPRNDAALKLLAKIFLATGDKNRARETLLKIENKDEEVTRMLEESLV